MDGNVEVEEDDGHVKVINVFGDNVMDEDISDVDGKTKKVKDEEDGEIVGDVKVIMDKGFTMIDDVTPRKKNLVVKVRDVSSWWQPGYGNNHPTFEVVLMDEQGFVLMRLRSSDEKDSVSILEENLIDSSPKKEILGTKSGSLDLNMLDSGLNEEITPSALVMDGNVEVESSVVGFKRQMEAECFDPTELNMEVDEKSQVMGRLNKKQKLHGRSPKMQGEIGCSRQILDENDEEVGESALLIGKEQKIQKRRGRPRKTQGEIGSSRKILDENDVEEVDESALLIIEDQKKQKRRGRPRKTQGEIGSSRKILDENDVEEVDESALLIGKEQKIPKRRGRPCKTQGEIGSSRKILDENDVEEVDESALLIGKEQKKQKRRGRPPKMHGETVKNNDHTTAEDTVKNTNTLKLKSSIGGADSRRMEKRLVRDQIVSMIVKAGWTIEYRPRKLNRHYLDAVYVDQHGKTHWSTTKAYFSLKMRIEKGVACKKEVSAFASIPDEELSVLLKSVSKVRSGKNMKKKMWKKKGKNACKAELENNQFTID